MPSHPYQIFNRPLNTKGVPDTRLGAEPQETGSD